MKDEADTDRTGPLVHFDVDEEFADPGDRDGVSFAAVVKMISDEDPDKLPLFADKRSPGRAEFLGIGHADT